MLGLNCRGGTCGAPCRARAVRREDIQVFDFYDDGFGQRGPPSPPLAAACQHPTPITGKTRPRIPTDAHECQKRPGCLLDLNCHLKANGENANNRCPVQFLLSDLLFLIGVVGVSGLFVQGEC